MTKWTTNWIWGVSAAAVVLMCAGASADIPRKSLWLGVYGGTHISEAWQLGDLEGTGDLLGDSAVWGLRVGGTFLPWLGVEANLGYIPAKSTKNENTQTIDAGLSLVIQGAMGRMGFYALGGGGLYASTGEVLGSDVDWQAHVGVGVKAQILEQAALRIQARYLFTDGPQIDPGNEVSENLELTLGLDFFAWRTADDRDQDGIDDNKDACPDVVGVKSAGGCPDKDGDGIKDSDDACPHLAGVASADGCPDKDGDGIKDSDDACRDVAGKAALKGCPDTDGDGIADKDDRCPHTPGSAEHRGCPDKDGDGLIDAKDACPDQAGPKKTRGCPDQDGDGIADKDDKCPALAGIPEEKGCLPKAVAEKFSGALKGIYFKTGSAKIKRKSFKVLDEAVAILAQYPSVHVRVEGHTDDRGKDEDNLLLSQGRAKSVKAYLVEKGIDSKRIKAVGYGETKPVADNKKRAGRTANRRIEFRVINH